jgi:creatinine amidohydrolase
MQFIRMTWPQQQALSRDIPVILPIAAVEQHGEHMPCGTDTILTMEIVARMEKILGNRALIGPTLWLGNSDHHLDFGATISAAPRTYLDCLHSLVENMLSAGFRRILLLNGHGGNDVPGKQAVFELRQKYRDRSDLLLLLSTYWTLGFEPWLKDPSIQQREMGHACEWETSMMLAIDPSLVGDYKATKTVEFGNSFHPASRGWITKDRSPVGHIGSPQFASAAKGEILLSGFSEAAVGLVERMIQWDGKSWEG